MRGGHTARQAFPSRGKQGQRASPTSGWAAGGQGLALLAAVVATIGIFLPSFAFILLATPLLRRWQKQPRLKTFLSGVLAGVPGAIAASALSLTLTALQVGSSWLQVVVFVMAMILSVSGRVKPLPLMALAIALGLLREWIV